MRGEKRGKRREKRANQSDNKRSLPRNNLVGSVVVADVRTHLYTLTHTHIYTYICVCACVKREKERDANRECASVAHNNRVISHNCRHVIIIFPNRFGANVYSL